MSNPSIREALERLRQTGKPELVAVADAVGLHLDTGDPAAVGKLLPLANDYTLRQLAEGARDEQDPDSRTLLDFVAIAMNSGDAAFPVAPDRSGSGGAPVQSPAEDFAAGFLASFGSRFFSSNTSLEPAGRRLLEAAARQGVEDRRLAACLLGALAHSLRFGWEETSDHPTHMGWGLNVANSGDLPPQHDREMGVLDRAVWDLPDEDMIALLRQQKDGPKSRYGEFTHRLGKLHGALAALRPSVLERFIDQASPAELAGLKWSMIVRATAAFDRHAVAFAGSHYDAGAMRLLVLIDGLRPGACTDSALEKLFTEELIPDESALCYLRDRQPDRLADYLQHCTPKLKELSALTDDTLLTSCRKLAGYWQKGGREVAMAFVRAPLAPGNFHGDGRTSIQGTAFRGLLAADTPPPPDDLREYLMLAEQAIAASPLKGQDQLEVRRYFHHPIAELHAERFVDILWELFADRSKTLRDLAIDGLSKAAKGEVLPQAIEHLGAGKAEIRASAANLLERLADPAAATALASALKSESSDKVRAALHTALTACGGGSEPAATPTPAAGLADIEHAAAKLKRPKTALQGLDTLPPLRTTDGAALPDQLLTFLIAKQANHKPIEAAPDIVPLLARLDRESSGSFALALVERFLDSDQSASDRWALTLGGLLGDTRIIPPLLSRIQYWCENSRHKLAEYAAQAISLLPGDEPLMVLDTLATRYRSKFKNVGKACAAAFEAAATARGITPDELGDMVVPRFDFDEEGVRRFEWDGGGISAELAPDFKLSWFDPETEKSWKSLPASAPDEVKADVKTLNKMIRETVKGQTARLELSLVRQRRWPVARWRELYECHPVLRSFASGLVWGIYDGSGGLLRTFRRYPNGLLADAGGALEELEESGAAIGMVHPLELDESTLEAWRAHLGRMKVKPPFPQIDRAVERLDPLHANRRELALTRGKELGAGTFKSRSEKRGWVRGSVVDAGGISSVYKPYPGAGVEAILVTDNYWVGIDPMDSVQLGSAYFVTAGTVERGSYTYDEPGADDPRVLRFDQVPAVVYSETLADLKAILGSGK